VGRYPFQMETKWASLVSYGLTAQALKDFLSVDATLNATTVQNHTLTIAQRCEDELGEEQWAFVEGCLADWGRLPIPDGPITVGIDGGYVRDWDEKKGHFEVIVGKSILAFRRDAAVATGGNATARKLLKAIEEFHTYIANDQGFIPNYGERYRYGERIRRVLWNRRSIR
jgi:hypothetical protein